MLPPGLSSAFLILRKQKSCFEPRSSDRKSEMIGYPKRNNQHMLDFLQTGLHHGSATIRLLHLFLIFSKFLYYAEAYYKVEKRYKFY